MVVVAKLGSNHLYVHLFNQLANQLVFECAPYMPASLPSGFYASKLLPVLCLLKNFLIN